MRRMHNKGQLGVLTIIFGLVIFVILWALFFGTWLNTWAQNAITVNSLTGIEAFLLANINLWVGIGVLIGSVTMMYSGGGK